MTYWSVGVGMIVMACVLALIAISRKRQAPTNGIYLAAYLGGLGVVFGDMLPSTAVALAVALWVIGAIVLVVLAFGTEERGQ